MAQVKKVEAKEGTISVSRTVLGKTTVKEDKIQVRPFVSETAFVSVKKGFTKSTGSYESARCDIMIGMPCYPIEVPEMFKRVNEVVEKLIDREAAIICGESGDTTKK